MHRARAGLLSSSSAFCPAPSPVEAIDDMVAALTQEQADEARPTPNTRRKTTPACGGRGGAKARASSHVSALVARKASAILATYTIAIPQVKHKDFCTAELNENLTNVLHILQSRKQACTGPSMFDLTIEADKPDTEEHAIEQQQSDLRAERLLVAQRANKWK